ncbi:helix-turn-helix domain-containing protein, partial [Acinetobacter baumannii]
MDKRLAFIADALSGLFTMVDLCARYEISRKTGYKWLARYAQEGVSGLEDRSRAPHV